ncbi:MAG: hypothetical protein GMKNLPBB_01928 [Myxococcota bacterium]|nr:hypothetical protein [Myxococcota bacterium]
MESIPDFPASAAPTAAPGQAEIQIARGEKIAVVDFRGSGLPDGVVAGLTDLVVMELQHMNVWEIVSRNSIRALLKVEEQKQLLGCDEASCYRDFSRLMDVRFIVAGTVSKTGNLHVLNLELIDAHAPAVLDRVSQRLAGDQDDLSGAIRSAVHALMAAPLQAAGGKGDSLSGDLLNAMKLARRPKRFNLNIGPVLEIPFLESRDDAKILPVYPLFLRASVEASLTVAPWLQVFTSTGFSWALSRNNFQQTQLAFTVVDVKGGGSQTGYTSITTELDYSAWRLPFVLGAKLRPSQGTFLPWMGAGAGVSLMHFAPERGFTTVRDFEASGGNQEKSGVRTEMEPVPHDALNVMYLDMTAGVGFDYLISDLIGLSVDMRWLGLQHIRGKRDILMSGPSQSVEGTNERGERSVLVGRAGDIQTVPRFAHYLTIGASFIIHF